MNKKLIIKNNQKNDILYANFLSFLLIRIIFQIARN